MTKANAVNAIQQGIQYQNTAGAWSGLDGGTAGQVLTSNGTGVASSFQPVTLPSAISWFAHLSATTGAVTGDGSVFTLVCDAVDINVGSGYDAMSGQFTVPVGGSGNYFIAVQIEFDSVDASHVDGQIIINGTALLPIANDFNPAANVGAGNRTTVNMFGMFPLVAGNTVSVTGAVSGGALAVTLFGSAVKFTYFMGYKV